MATLQQIIDAFVQQATTAKTSPDVARYAHVCMEDLSEYLSYFSDLFQDQEMIDEGELAEWESGLNEHMNHLLEGDIDPVSDLGSLPLAALEPEHLRDFLCWFVVRERGDSEQVRCYSAVLAEWLAYIAQRGLWNREQFMRFQAMLDETAPAALRTVQLSQVLFHFVRAGAALSPRQRGQRFFSFVEGHARVVAVGDGFLRFVFEENSEEFGPIMMPAAVLKLIEVGDLFDVEIGLRGDCWVMVDIGPIYPRCVSIDMDLNQGAGHLI